VAGLGVFEGEVVRFPTKPGLKVPHMGWNRVRLTHPEDPAWAGQEADPYFYFVHSYYPAPADPDLTAGSTDYDGDFVCAIQRGNLMATQFHPEKSQSAGLSLLGQFVRRHGLLPVA
jgi:glutamine amidotransferase